MSASNDKRIFQQWTDVMVQFFTSVQVCKFDPNKCISDQIQYSVLTWCKDFVIYSRMWNVKRVWIRIAGDACIAFFVWHVIYIYSMIRLHYLHILSPLTCIFLMGLLWSEHRFIEVVWNLPGHETYWIYPIILITI